MTPRPIFPVLKVLLGLVWLLMPVFVYAAGDTRNTDRRNIHLLDGQMSVYFESPFSATEKEKLLHWLKVSAETISTLYGEFPVKQTHVHLYSKRNAGEPVPWGEVWKNGAYRVNFQVNPQYPLSYFLDDWTASHELSHLLHPHPGSGNAWFGEGLASYYQNILRVRQGSLSEQAAWQKLLEGFQRGENNVKRTGMSLFQASQNMRASRSFMHVYWGGAAYFLNVDIRLRQITKGRESLDTAWFKFKKCCLFHGNHWPLDKLISELDQLTGTAIFTEEYNKIIRSPVFPDYQDSFQQLGISIRNNKVVLKNSSLQAALRRELVASNHLK